MANQSNFLSPIRIASVFLSVVFFVGCQHKNDDKSATSTGEPSLQLPSQNHHAAKAIAGAKYVDDHLCADCHQQVFDTYQHVAMAKSFYDFDPKNTVEDFKNNQFYHPASDNHYQMEVVDGQFQMTRFKKRPDGSTFNQLTQTAHFVVGSGNHVRTYVRRSDTGEMYQLPVVWYTQDRKWGMAPGYDRPDHPDFQRPITRHCMFCHNAYPDFESGSDSFGQPHLFPEKLPQGIGCQRCHGPGSVHVRISNELDTDKPEDLVQIKNSIVNTGNLDAQTQDDVCFQCHLQPMSQRTSFVRKFGCNDYGFTAGQKLKDFMIYFEPDRDNQKADHFEINHHPYRLRQSECYIKTEGGIRCTTCHDPHRKIDKLEQQKFYRQKCLTCHGPDDCLDEENGHNKNSDCVACHMPKRRTTDVVNVTMTDHKIVRNSSSDLTRPLSEIDVPIQMPIREYSVSGKQLPPNLLRIYEYFARALDDDESVLATFNDQLASDANVLLEPNLQLMQKLIQNSSFEQARAAGARLSTYEKLPASYMVNSGLIEIGLGNNEIGLEKLNLAVKQNPNYAGAWYNLGVAYSKMNNSPEALSCFEKSIELRNNYVKAFIKVGSRLAINDHYQKASENFLSALQYDPRNLEAYQKLAAVYRRQNKWDLCILVLKDAMRIEEDSNPRLVEDLVLSLLDIRNEVARDPRLALQLAGRNQKEADSTESKLLNSLAHIENEQPNRALELIASNLSEEARKPENGLLMAVSQKQIGSTKPALKNFEGGRNVLVSKNKDRISRVILEYAESIFGTKN